VPPARAGAPSDAPKKPVVPVPVPPAPAAAPGAAAKKPVVPAAAPPKKDPSSAGARPAKDPSSSGKHGSGVVVVPKTGTKDALVGQVIARCAIEARIGEGRTSVVYRATHTALGIPVAVKILKPAVLAYPEIVSQFENEARSLARLDHPNVLKIYDVASEGDRHGIVMELLEGESVLDLLEREERLDPMDALRIVRQAASGLVAAHAKNTIHRDVKPQNLVVLPDGTVKLVDFGLATAHDSEMAASRIGTPHYMAPEVCDAKPAVPNSDVYGLGVTLYHMLVGSPPHAGMSVREIISAHVEGKPLHPERRLPGLPKPICNLVRDMTKRDPLTRLSAQEVVAATDAIGGKSLASSPRLKIRRRTRGVGKKGRVPAVAIVGIALAVVGVAALLLSRSGGGDNGAKKPPPKETGATGPEAPPEAGTGETPESAGTPKPPPDKTTNGAKTPTPPATPSRPPVDEEQRARAEAMRQREAAGKTAFEEATAFARENWQDKAAVVAKYRTVASEFRDTAVAKDAARRADGIEKGDVHPHPDRVFAPPSAVETAKAAWEKAKPEVEAALAAMRYDEAERLVPAAVADREGTLSDELEFWRRLARDGAALLRALGPAIESIPLAQRKLKTAKGEGKIVAVASTGPKVQVGDERMELLWSDIAPDGLMAVAEKALAGKGHEAQVQLVSFAFVHRLRDSFFQTAIAVTASGEPGPGTEHVNRALARSEERFKKP
jgi:serine/threonine-protein kinase